MGASVGVAKIDRRVATIFVDQNLARGEILLKTNASMLGSFVDFLKKESWIDLVENKEEMSLSKLSMSDCVWKRYGYKIPVGYRGGKVSQSSSSESTFDQSVVSLDSCGGSFNVSLETTVNIKKSDRYIARPSAISTLFKDADLRAILISLLYPVYLCSLQYRDLRNDRIHENEAAPLPLSRGKPVTLTRRMREWLQGVVALFDATSLTKYISDPRGSWIEDYKHALASLPVGMWLSTVNAAQRESTIVYSNACATPTTATTSEALVCAAQLHITFAQDCSLSGAEQVASAIFGAKKYQRTLVDDETGACRLRVLKPIYNTQGTHVYALGLESVPFMIDFDNQSDSQVADHCQELEDLLELLPLFVRG